MNPVRNLLTQARHELGLLRVLQECTVVPGALLVLGMLAWGWAVMG